jgi:hypothetical protein
MKPRWIIPMALLTLSACSSGNATGSASTPPPLPTTSSAGSSTPLAATGATGAVNPANPASWRRASPSRGP